MKDLLTIINDNNLYIEEAMHGYLGEEISDKHKILLEAMRYSAYSGGKRIRPFLTLEFCKILGGDVKESVPFAIAIEMIHSYSLIHDDLPCMDNDDLRRGKPTNHKMYGEATALLAGDSLLTYSFGIAASAEGIPAEHKLAAVKLLSDMAGYRGMAGGQMIDLVGENEELSYDSFLLMNNLKTGCLIKTACLLGCLAAGYGSDTAEYKDASEYADRIGLAFQIEDDILDYGTEDNKTTFLSFMSIEDAKKKVAELTNEAVSIIGKYDASGVLTQFAEYLSNRNV